MKRFVVVCVLSLAPIASASHYLIRDVPDVIPAVSHATLDAQGIQNTAQLYERVVARTSRSALSKAARIEAKDLDAWARFLDLLQLPGIGPKMVRLLNAAGIDSLAAFQKANAATLHPQMRTVNLGNKYSEVVPPADVVAAWIEAAKLVPARLE